MCVLAPAYIHYTFTYRVWYEYWKAVVPSTAALWRHGRSLRIADTTSANIVGHRGKWAEKRRNPKQLLTLVPSM